MTTGEDLDRKMREILMAATRSNALTSSAKLVALGFPAVAALKMVSDIVLEKERRASDG